LSEHLPHCLHRFILGSMAVDSPKCAGKKKSSGPCDNAAGAIAPGVAPSGNTARSHMIGKALVETDWLLLSKVSARATGMRRSSNRGPISMYLITSQKIQVIKYELLYFAYFLMLT
jgi:hypothetical protein